MPATLPNRPRLMAAGAIVSDAQARLRSVLSALPADVPTDNLERAIAALTMTTIELEGYAAARS